MFLKYSTTALALGVIIDAVFGDPQVPWHPIRLIGKLIAAAERRLRRLFPQTRDGERRAGAVMAAAIPASVFLTAAAVSGAAFLLNRYAFLIVESLMCASLLAAGSLRSESMKVYRAITAGDIEGARRAVSMIVGRDTGSLNEAGITRAAVETVAENASDGVIAPLLFAVIGGAPLGFLYKAINTMDSMVGYKNDRYIDFGRAAARLDDAANFVPSRLSAILMIAVSAPLGMDCKGAARIFHRDRKKHSSPNSAQTEAVCAGALGVRLGGDASYFGKLQKKHYIGDDSRPIEPDDIKRANRLMHAASLLAAALLIAAKAAVCKIIGG